MSLPFFIRNIALPSVHPYFPFPITIMIDRSFVQAALVPLTYRITVMGEGGKNMHRQKCYNTCQRYFGKVVRIEDRDGHIHLGKIIDVTNDSVWIEPVQQRSSFDTGFGYYGAYSNGGCDICGGLSRCDNCGFGCGGGFDGGFSGGCADVAVVVAAVVALVAAGALNSDLALFLELLWLHYFSSNIVKS